MEWMIEYQLRFTVWCNSWETFHSLPLKESLNSHRYFAVQNVSAMLSREKHICIMFKVKVFHQSVMLPNLKDEPRLEFWLVIWCVILNEDLIRPNRLFTPGCNNVFLVVDKMASCRNNLEPQCTHFLEVKWQYQWSKQTWIWVLDHIIILPLHQSI